MYKQHRIKGSYDYGYSFSYFFRPFKIHRHSHSPFQISLPKFFVIFSEALMSELDMAFNSGLTVGAEKKQNKKENKQKKPHHLLSYIYFLGQWYEVVYHSQDS